MTVIELKPKNKRKALPDCLTLEDKALLCCESDLFGWRWLTINPKTASLEEVKNVGPECWGERADAAIFTYEDAVDLAGDLNAESRRRKLPCGFYVEKLDE